MYISYAVQCIEENIKEVEIEWDFIGWNRWIIVCIYREF
jgi:hypothetical protein